jgi:hypothetical protein
MLAQHQTSMDASVLRWWVMHLVQLPSLVMLVQLVPAACGASLARWQLLRAILGQHPAMHCH